jgi:hypothetical protein
MQQHFLLVGERDRLFAAHSEEQQFQMHEANLSRNEFARHTNETLTQPAQGGVSRIVLLSADVALILLMGAVVLSRAANCSIPLAVAFSASSSK